MPQRAESPQRFQITKPKPLMQNIATSTFHPRSSQYSSIVEREVRVEVQSSLGTSVDILSSQNDTIQPSVVIPRNETLAKSMAVNVDVFKAASIKMPKSYFVSLKNVIHSIPKRVEHSPHSKSPSKFFSQVTQKGRTNVYRSMALNENSIDDSIMGRNDRGNLLASFDFSNKGNRLPRNHLAFKSVENPASIHANRLHNSPSRARVHKQLAANPEKAVSEAFKGWVSHLPESLRGSRRTKVSQMPVPVKPSEQAVPRTEAKARAAVTIDVVSMDQSPKVRRAAGRPDPSSPQRLHTQHMPTRNGFIRE